MNILFVYPNIDAQIGFNYGVAFLSAVLRERGHRTALINVNDKLGYPLDLERIARDTAAFAPDLIGLSLVTNQYQYGRKIAVELKRRFPDVPIAAGGVHVTMAAGKVLTDCPAIDYVCVGEGEDAFAELVDRLERGEPTDSIPNIWVRRNGEIVSNHVRPFPDLELLPRKDYSIFDFQRLIDAKNGWVGLMASRGCPFRCSYCFNHKIVRLYEKDTGLRGHALGYIRRHPVDDVIAEIDFLLNSYDRITTFIFDDDLFTMDKNYTVEFCRKYAERFDVPYVVNGHVQVFDDEVARALKEGGCWMVKFGLESGSQRVRDQVMHRRMTNDQIARAFDTAARAGLETSAFVMFGLPHETRDDIMATINLLAEIKPTRFRWAIFFPFVGTDAYQMAYDAGLINFDRMQRLSNFMDASCLDFDPAHNLFIEKLQKTFPWWVNAAARWPCSRRYLEMVDRVDAMDRTAFEAVRDTCRAEDERVSAELCRTGATHYAIKYNAFMAVKQP